MRFDFGEGSGTVAVVDRSQLFGPAEHAVSKESPQERRRLHEQVSHRSAGERLYAAADARLALGALRMMSAEMLHLVHNRRELLTVYQRVSSGRSRSTVGGAENPDKSLFVVVRIDSERLRTSKPTGRGRSYQTRNSPLTEPCEG